MLVEFELLEHKVKHENSYSELLPWKWKFLQTKANEAPAIGKISILRTNIFNYFNCLITLKLYNTVGDTTTNLFKW